MDLKPRSSPDGSVSPTAQGWRLAIPAGPPGRYRLAQLDDQSGLSRNAFLWRPPLTMSLRARLSSMSTPGTWGFGLWNDPFGFAFIPGRSFFRLPALPNSLWFFHASPLSYLSFRDDKPARGFLAQVFHSPRFDRALVPAGLAFPFSHKTTRRMLSRLIAEDSTGLDPVDTGWHTYRLDWSSSGSAFWVDGRPVLQSPISPRGPLGIVVWIDNQYAAFTPDGNLSWGIEINPLGETLDIEGLEVKMM